MITQTPPLSNRLIEHLPQTARLRSGLYVSLRNRSDTGEFWHVFSSREYLALVPHLMGLPMARGRIIDCGAGIGLFSLLVEHLCRVGVLPWTELHYALVEPGSYNFAQLRKNSLANLPADRCRLYHNLVGQKAGTADFFESRKHPWSSSILDRPGKRTRRTRREFLDLTPLLNPSPCLMKMDIEGAEFSALEAYASDLRHLTALIIEWHGEMGDIRTSESILAANGLRHCARSWDNGNRLVDLYVNEMMPTATAA